MGACSSPISMLYILELVGAFLWSIYAIMPTLMLPPVFFLYETGLCTVDEIRGPNYKTFSVVLFFVR